MVVHVHVLLILVFTGCVTAPFVSRLQCPDVPVISDFNIKRYAGTWYEIERFDNPLQVDTRCISYKYFPRRNGNMRVSYTRLEMSVNKTTTRGILRQVNARRPNYFKLTLEAIRGLAQNVIYTDYKRHAVLYGCDDATNLEWAFILSRNRQPRRRKKCLYKYLTDLGAQVNLLVPSNQTGCDML
ncbi:apolipoprotein D-like [Ylistrum balloti]|uniref:apolipoprotein D-like n=1 Tax=Ylistrum balloti TaxID=509963 RepID=UPI0029059C81|nr:apolipoprotein D-like [Ylistrum balloti]